MGSVLNASDGTLGSGSSGEPVRGMLKLVVYGDKKTMTPSSWELYEWANTWTKRPDTQTDIYDWRKIEDFHGATSKDRFWECRANFTRERENFLKEKGR